MREINAFFHVRHANGRPGQAPRNYVSAWVKIGSSLGSPAVRFFPSFWGVPSSSCVERDDERVVGSWPNRVVLILQGGVDTAADVAFSCTGRVCPQGCGADARVVKPISLQAQQLCCCLPMRTRKDLDNMCPSLSFLSSFVPSRLWKTLGEPSRPGGRTQTRTIRSSLDRHHLSHEQYAPTRARRYISRLDYIMVFSYFLSLQVVPHLALPEAINRPLGAILSSSICGAS